MNRQTTAGESALIKAGAYPRPCSTPWGDSVMWLWSTVYDEDGEACGNDIEVSQYALDLCGITDCVVSA